MRQGVAWHFRKFPHTSRRDNLCETDVVAFQCAPWL